MQPCFCKLEVRVVVGEKKMLCKQVKAVIMRERDFDPREDDGGEMRFTQCLRSDEQLELTLMP